MEIYISVFTSQYFIAVVTERRDERHTRKWYRPLSLPLGPTQETPRWCQKTVTLGENTVRKPYSTQSSQGISYLMTMMPGPGPGPFSFYLSTLSTLETETFFFIGAFVFRSYYRCAHKSLGCVAKKKVQRMDEDPFMMEITYHFHHTCRTPSLLPSSSSTRAMFEAPQPPPPPSASTSIRFGSWISGEFEVDQKDKNEPDECHVPVHSRQEGGSGTGESSSVHVEASHVRDVSVREEPVENIADFLFNSRTSDNSMDSIFSLKPE